MADFVEPGNSGPGAAPGANPTDSQLTRVAKSNAAVVAEMTTFRGVTKNLFDAVVAHGGKIDSHAAALQRNIESIEKLLGSNRSLDTRLEALIAAINENTRAILQHRDDLKASSAVIADHKAASLKLIEAVQALK